MMNSSLFNAEAIRDFCGGTWNRIEKSGWDTVPTHTIYLYHLPDAVDKLCRVYHFNISGGSVDESKKIVYNILVKELEDVIPVDCEKWEDAQKAVYEKVFNIKYLDLGERLRFVCKAIIKSDYWRAIEYVDKNIEDKEMHSILIMAIHGNANLSKVDTSSIERYHKRFH